MLDWNVGRQGTCRRCRRRGYAVRRKVQTAAPRPPRRRLARRILPIEPAERGVARPGTRPSGAAARRRTLPTARRRTRRGPRPRTGRSPCPRRGRRGRTKSSYARAQRRAATRSTGNSGGSGGQPLASPSRMSILCANSWMTRFMPASSQSADASTSGHDSSTGPPGIASPASGSSCRCTTPASSSHSRPGTNSPGNTMTFSKSS